MNIPIELVGAFIGGVFLSLGGIVKFLIGVLKEIRGNMAGILEHLGKLNGRVGKSETWQEMHEKQDDDRFEQLEKQTDALWSAVRAK